MISRSKLAATTTLGLVLGIVVISAGLGGSGENQTNPVDPVTVSGTIADPETGRRQIAGLGVVEPKSGEVDLAGLMPGVISVINVEEGDSVKKDQILAELVNDDLKAKVAQAKAQLTIRKAELDRVRNGAREQEIMQARAQLKQEEGALSLLKLQFDRRKKLARAGAVSQEAFNTAESALIAGQQRRDAAEQALSLLVEGSRSEDLMASGAQVDLAQHQLEEAEAALGKSYIRASTDGIVLRLYREPGEALSTQPASPIIQIGDTSRLVVRAQIDEADIGMLKVGQKATITAQALSGKSLEGVVRRISPRVGAKTIVAGSPTEKRDARVLDVLIDLQPEAKLPISLRVDVFIDVGEGEAAPAVPAADKEGAPAAELQLDGQKPDQATVAASEVMDGAASPAVEIMPFGDKVSSIGPVASRRSAIGILHPELEVAALPGTGSPLWFTRFPQHSELDPLGRFQPPEVLSSVREGLHPEIDPVRPVPVSGWVAANERVDMRDDAAPVAMATTDDTVAPDLSTWALRIAP
jgi:HlyD family secretion protein